MKRAHNLYPLMDQCIWLRSASLYRGHRRERNWCSNEHQCDMQTICRVPTHSICCCIARFSPSACRRTYLTFWSSHLTALDTTKPPSCNILSKDIEYNINVVVEHIKKSSKGKNVVVEYVQYEFALFFIRRHKTSMSSILLRIHTSFPT